MQTLNAKGETMTKLNKNTKKAKAFIQAYNNAPLHRNLNDCYSRYSSDKAWAYKDCLKMVEKFSGYDYTIVGYNCMMFTFAFWYVENGHRFLYYITRYNDYVIQLD